MNYRLLQAAHCFRMKSMRTTPGGDLWSPSPELARCAFHQRRLTSPDHTACRHVTPETKETPIVSWVGIALHF